MQISKEQRNHNEDKITDILKHAKETKQPYPKTFEALKEAGVISYEVRFKERYDGKYTCTFGQYQEPQLPNFTPVKVAPNFSKEEVARVIKRHIEEKTDFATELLHELGAAGVSHYKVDMKDRTVIYYDENERNSLKEAIPLLSNI